MKIPQIISEIKSMLASECLTVYRQGRVLCIKGQTRYIPLIEYVDLRWRVGRQQRMQLPLRHHWGINYRDMDHAIFGDGRSRRQKWIRAWLLRELGLSEHSGSKDDEIEGSDHVWMEAANA